MKDLEIAAEEMMQSWRDDRDGYGSRAADAVLDRCEEDVRVLLAECGVADLPDGFFVDRARRTA